MNYTAWGQQYLDEAAALSERIRALRAESADMTLDRARRIGTLYSMYLECSVIGHDLQRRGQIREGHAG